MWKPRLRSDLELAQLRLTPEEGFLVSRIDGATTVDELSLLTGLSADRVGAVLARLVAEQALEPPPPSPEEPFGDQDASADAEPVRPEDDSDAAAVAIDEQEGTHRKLFEARLHPLPVDQRVAQARTAEEPVLSALCFDPVPSVIQALLDNPRCGLVQARLIAAHHRNPVGLEALAARASFAADPTVRRWLVRNPQLPAGLFRRMYAGRRLLEQFQLAVSRELPEQTRRTAREVMRQRFATGPAEERVELIFKTDGRCLASLTGLSVDSKTTSLLCGRTYRSTLLVQSLARWSAAPPPLIAHLLRQELVRRSPQLRTLLQRHPNAPADARGR